MKRILMTLLVLIVCLSFWGCSADDGQREMETDKPVGSEEDVFKNYDYAEKIPKLFVEYGDKKVQAVSGTFSWNVSIGEESQGIEGDSEGPDKLVLNQEQEILVDKDTQLLLAFSRQPISFEVRVYDPSDASGSEKINDGFSIMFKAGEPRTIYEVTAKFKFSDDGIEETGTIHYAFAVN